MATIPNAEGQDAVNIKNPGDASGLEVKINSLGEIIHLVLVVLKVGFITILVAVILGVGAMIQSALTSKQISYQNLANQVTTQNAKMDDLIQIMSAQNKN